ncbi:hypothetical protein ACFLT4_04810 [Chloroflexota bacterium]
MFEGVAVIGLILGIPGGAWYAGLPLLALAGAAMIFTFSTTRRREEWKARQTSKQ